MLLVDISSQHKKIPSAKNVIQITIKQGSENVCDAFENPPKLCGKGFCCDDFYKSTLTQRFSCLKHPEHNDKFS
ncbi:hypothetical protein DS259_03120 [Salmonella enterica subsp. indica]|nr:hypothetical protein [Salmonella enterica subsp. indica]